MIRIGLTGFLALALASGTQSAELSAQRGTADSALTATITVLDTQVFDAYNRCDLAAFAGYFTPDVEFYHDEGGVTFDRRTVVANTRRFICRKVRRELIPGSLRVYPIKNFGAIAEGEHLFCQLSTQQCDGVAKFLMVWRRRAGRWQLIRVMSYGHRAITDR